MLSLGFIKGLDRRWLAALGLLGACGPLPPAETGTEGTSGTSTGETPPTAGPTSGMTTGLLPQCVEDADCGVCGWCQEGSCVYDYCCEYGCCFEVPESGELRCSPPYWCYSDEECPDGEVCEYGYCVLDRPPPPPGQLPACPPGQADTTQWNLTATPGGLGLGDLDGDGDLDLFAALPATGEIELAFNDGTGTFTPGGVVKVGEPQTEVRVAGGDLDGDGDFDLAVSRPDASDLVVLFNQDGVFVPGAFLPASAPPRTILAADLDGDGDRDLMTFGGDLDVVSAWDCDGLGGFAAEEVLLDLTEARASMLQHLEGDGIPDLLALSHPDAPPTLTLYRGSPSVALVHTFDIPLEEPGWTQALAGQMGVDPHPDLVLVRESDGLVHVWPSLGELGWFEPTGFATSVASIGGVLADVDGDGFDDLVAATGLALVNVLRSDGANGFACERVLEVGGATSRELLIVGELDGSPGAEVVVGSRDGPTVMVLRTP